MSDLVLQKFPQEAQQVRLDLTRCEKMAQEMLSEVEDSSFEIEDDQDFEVASEMLIAIKDEIKTIEKKRKEVTGPIYQALEAFREMYRPTLKKYKRAEELLKRWTGEYALKKREAEEVAMREIAAASQAGDFSKALEVSEKVEVEPKKKGLSFSDQWDYELEDLSQVPLEYLQVNDDAVMNYIKSFGKEKPKEIAGLRFFKRAKVRKTRG